jgi:vacuolar-type H+-ATPase subunit I/STV1
MTSTTMMTSGSAADDILLSSDRPSSRTSWGRPSRLLGLLSLIAGMIAAACVGLTIVPAELEAGRYLTDTSTGYQAGVLIALGVLLLSSLTGLAALVTGIVSLVRRERKAPSIVGIASAALAPVLWFAAFVIPVLIMASLAA